MQRIEIRRVSRDGRSVQTTTIFYGGPEPGELEQVKAGFEDVLAQGRRRRRWLVSIGAALLAIEAVILMLWRG